MSKIYCWDDILEVEDYLQVADIFYNMSTGRRNCSMDSYGTLVDFINLDKAIDTAIFEKEKIEYCINYWDTNPNCQPPIKIISKIWKRKLDYSNSPAKV